ncbi:MAG TPA: rhodanese-like domain-containing protein, partial [Methanosarcinales archaeon]|nr:rhodanese-like domain-containing protein [Methanosarcinales archaeon]
AVEQVDFQVLHSLDKKSILVDVREPEEFASGYIDAHTILTIPRGKLEFMAIDKIAKVFGTDIPIITYCLKGPRGSLAGYQLQKMGFSNVKNLKGGILQWLAEGNTIHSYLGDKIFMLGGTQTSKFICTFCSHSLKPLSDIFKLISVP